MQVLHVNCNYIGTTLHQKMIEHLSASGVESQVFVPTYSRNLSVINVNDNVTVSECFKKWERILFDYKQEKIINCLEHIYNVENFDCIHAYTVFTDGNCARRLSKKYGIPYVVAVRNTDVNTFFKHMVHLRNRGIQIMRDASAIFFLSESYKKQMFDRFIPKKYQEELTGKSYVIPNGIDDFWLLNSSVVNEKKSIQSQINIVFAGRIDKNKNIETTQKALSLLRKKGYDLRFSVVGKIDDQKVYRRIIKDSYTTYIEPQPKEQLLKIFRENNIFVMPSVTETFGLVYAEAMSQGLPVIYSKGQGFDGQFSEGEVGYSVICNSPESVANGIEMIIKQYPILMKNCVESVSRFAWNDICRKYTSIYNEICNGK